MAAAADPSWDPDYADTLQSRAAMASFCASYESQHPPSSYGYAARRVAVRMRDGGEIQVKLSQPLAGAGAGAPRALLFVTHGGAWKEGSAAIEEAFGLRAMLAALASERPGGSADLRPVVVAPEYRLAPEHPYPVPVHDAHDALEWAVAHAAGWGADARRVVLGGSSAGAQLAAVLAVEAAGGGVEGLGADGLAGLMLNVPAVCHPAHWPFGPEPLSYERVPEAMMGGDVARRAWGRFVKGKPDDGDWRVSPLIADLKGLPPTNLFVAGCCPFHDEGRAFHRRLLDAGVQSTLHVYEGVPHVFGADETNPKARDFYRDSLAAYKALFAAK